MTTNPTQPGTPLPNSLIGILREAAGHLQSARHDSIAAQCLTTATQLEKDARGEATPPSPAPLRESLIKVQRLAAIDRSCPRFEHILGEDAQQIRKIVHEALSAPVPAGKVERSEIDEVFEGMRKATQQHEIQMAVDALETAAERFTNPKWNCVWLDAAEDCQKRADSLKQLLESSATTLAPGAEGGM